MLRTQHVLPKEHCPLRVKCESTRHCGGRELGGCDGLARKQHSQRGMEQAHVLSRHSLRGGCHEERCGLQKVARQFGVRWLRQLTGGRHVPTLGPSSNSTPLLGAALPVAPWQAISLAAAALPTCKVTRRGTLPGYQPAMVTDINWASYRLPLQRQLTSAAGDSCRSGLMVHVSLAQGLRTLCGVGDVSPLPGLHIETVQQCAAQLQLILQLLRRGASPLPSALPLLSGAFTLWWQSSGIDPAGMYPSVRWVKALLRVLSNMYSNVT